MSARQNHLISEFGRTVGLPGLELDQDGKVVLTIDGLGVTLEALSSRQAFLLYGVVGSVPPSSSDDVRLRLWKVGTVSALSGFGSIGLDDDGSVLFVDTLNGCDLDDFRHELNSAVQQMRAWERRIADLARMPSGSDADLSVDAMSMIRA